MMKVIVVALLATVAFAGTPSNQIGGTNLLFSNSDEGLAWPITSGRDAGQLLPHGPHCIEMVMDYVNQCPNNPVDRLHDAHCRHLIREMITFFDTNTDFAMPKIICQDIAGLYEGFVPNANYYLNYRYTNLRENMTEEEANEATFDALRSYQLEHSAKFGKSQTSLFGLIMGQNLGALLMKEYTGKHLTAVEKEFLADWVSPTTVRLSAVGAYCITGHGSAPIGMLRNLLAQDCKN
jgi:hypothetical protein